MRWCGCAGWGRSATLVIFGSFLISGVAACDDSSGTPDAGPNLDAGGADAPKDAVGGDGGDSGGPGADGGDAGDGGTIILTPNGEPLQPVRRISFRRITQFPRGPEAKFISDAKISANGTTVIFGTFAGTYTIAADGSGMVQLSDKRNEGLVDISADGSKVVWYEAASREGYVSGRDGSGKVKLAGTHAVRRLRMTAAGDQIFQIAPEAGGLIKLPAGAGDLQLIKSTADVATLNKVDANGNHWRDVLDISDDGSKVVFSFLWDAFAMAGDGSGLMQHTQFLMPENRTLKLVRVSGTGARIAWNVEDGARSAVTFADWGGGNKLEYVGLNYSSASWLHFSGDGTKAALGWGIRLLDTAKLDPYDATDSGSNSIPLGRPAMVTLTRDGKRACLVVEGPESTDQGRPNQIVIVDFDPATAAFAPSFDAMATNLRLVPNDGSKSSSIFARVQGTNVTEVHTMGLRGGFRLSNLLTPWMNWALGDAGMNGDVTAKDGIYSTNALRFPTDAMVTPGPVGLRFTAANAAGHILMVDTAGLESRTP